jgi:hypothetical protein
MNRYLQNGSTATLREYHAKWAMIRVVSAIDIGAPKAQLMFDHFPGKQAS